MALERDEAGWFTGHRGHFPFIRFDLDFGRARPGLWDLAGRCTALFDLISAAPLKPALAEELHRVSLTKYIQGTAAIEGVTLDPAQIEAAVSRREDHVPEYSEIEIQNFLREVETIRQTKGSGQPLDLAPADLCRYNKAVLDGTLVGEGINVGHFRHHHVGVHGYGPPGPEKVAPLISDLCRWLNDSQASGLTALGVSATSQSLFRAVAAHVFFEMIHPFGDGNGRVGRLLELDLLARGGIPFPAALALTSFYNDHKNQYFKAIRAVEQSESSEGVFAFVEFALGGLFERSRGIAVQIQQQTLEALWKDFVYERTDGLKRRAAGRRQQALALALDDQPRMYRSLRGLSVQVAMLYRDRSDTILARDLGILRKLGVAERQPDGWAAAKHRMRAFLAPTQTPG